ncbi:MAG: trehalose-phosphatase [Terriglobales bacterium]
MLVACDFDGTLAPIVARPEDAAPLPGAVAALSALAGRRDCRVAVVSGRGLSDLRARCPVAGCWFVGGHGNEEGEDEAAGVARPPFVGAALPLVGLWPSVDPRQPTPAGAQGVSELPRRARARDPRVRQALAATAERLRLRLGEWPGSRLEAKPYSLAVHFRQAPERAEAIRQAFSELAGSEFRVLLGRQVVELLPAEALTKGHAVQRLRARLGCDLAIYFGDDGTDEDVFRLADPQVIGVKVEHGEAPQGTTRADFSVPSPKAVETALETIYYLRAHAEKKSVASQAFPT